MPLIDYCQLEENNKRLENVVKVVTAVAEPEEITVLKRFSSTKSLGIR